MCLYLHCKKKVVSEDYIMIKEERGKDVIEQ